MNSGPVPTEVRPDAECRTRHLTAELYCCMMKKKWCQHGLAFGNEVFCQHPDRASWRQPSSGSERPRDLTA